MVALVDLGLVEEALARFALQQSQRRWDGQRLEAVGTEGSVVNRRDAHGLAFLGRGRAGGLGARFGRRATTRAFELHFVAKVVLLVALQALAALVDEITAELGPHTPIGRRSALSAQRGARRRRRSSNDVFIGQVRASGAAISLAFFKWLRIHDVDFMLRVIAFTMRA